MKQTVVNSDQFGWLERANVLRVLLQRGILPDQPDMAALSKWFRHFLADRCRYNASTNRLTIAMSGRAVASYECIPGWECVEEFKRYGFADNPECLQVQE